MCLYDVIIIFFEYQSSDLFDEHFDKRMKSKTHQFYILWINTERRKKTFLTFKLRPLHTEHRVQMLYYLSLIVLENVLGD